MFARNVGRVNAVLMTHARVPLRLGELARAANLPRQIASSALQTLEKRGLVRRTRVGDHDVFAPDGSSPYYPSAYLAALIDLPFASALDPFRPFAAFVYGSMAAPGQATAQSDLDLLVVGDFRDKDAVHAAVSTVGTQIGRRVDVFLMTPEQLEAGRARDDQHVRSALAGVRLFGEV